MHNKIVRRLLKSLLYTLLVLGLLFWLITSDGNVSKTANSSKDVSTSQRVLSGTLRQLSHADDRIELEFNQQQLDALMNVASYTTRHIQFSGVISDFGVALHAGADISALWANRTIKAYCLLLPGPAGFAIDHCQFGKIPIPAFIANNLMKLLVSVAIAAPADKQLLALFAKGELRNGKIHFIDDNAAALKLRLNPQLYTAKNLAQSLFQTDAVLAPEISFYLQELAWLAQQHKQERTLAFYTQKLLLTASERANGNPVKEYNNALWALAVGFGNKHFIRYANPETDIKQIPALPRVVLLNRHDLTLHFLYSAVFQVLGSAQLSEQIGNLKEILDADTGGSGFSFVDLAADRAGIRFAQQLAQIDAALLGRLSSSEFEAAMMPAIDHLPEGLTEQQIQQQLGGFNGDGFRQLEQLIMQRIAALALYKHN